MDKFQKPRSIFFPLLLVVLGVFLLLANLGTIPNTAWDIVATYWPLIFVIGGLDGLYQHHGWAGPLVGIGLGTVLLLGNLHYLQWSSLDLLLRLWPILLVAWGLDIAFGHNDSVWSTLIRVGLGLLLVVGIIWLSIASPFGGSVKTVAFNQPLDGAQKSVLDFSMAAGEMNLSGGAAADTLVSGTLVLPKDMTLTPDYQAPTNGASRLSLEGNGVVIMSFGNSTPWNLKLNSLVPLDITSRLGSGNMIVDLSDLMVNQFNSEVGVGRTELILPTSGGTSGKIELAVGELIIRVPKGSRVILHTNIGLASKQLPAGYTDSKGLIQSNSGSGSATELTVNLAVGSLAVQEIQ